jgi:peptide/nickel transport system permease protein
MTRGARVAWVVLAGFVVLAAAAGVLPHGPTATRTGGEIAVLEAPSARHWLGTDDVGRDVAARLAHGARTSLALAALVTLLSTAAGLAGALAAAARPLARRALVAVADTLGAVPPLLFTLTLAGLLGAASIPALALVLALPRAADVARVADAELARALALPHAEAARALGASRWRITTRHALALAAPQLAVLAAATFATTVLAEAALTFVGAGVRPPTPSWGELLAQAHRNGLAWWLAVPAAAATTALALCANAIADGIGGARRGGS